MKRDTPLYDSPFSYESQLKLDVKQESLLKLIVCGSVDDGKSTLIGRMLFDSEKVCDDHIQNLKRDTQRLSKEEELDFSLLVDGLKEEREQGITIDLSYHFFSTSKRRYMLIDAPGHEQYTKNMAAGASIASVGIILIDATKGILPQTIRHTYILYLMGIRHFILCVNKIDLVKFSEIHFNKLSNNYEDLLKSILKSEDYHFYSLPVCATTGINLYTKGVQTPWYQGIPLYQYLDEIRTEDILPLETIFSVQMVSRPNADFRGYMGTLLGGHLAKGDEVKLLPSNHECKIEKIVTFDGERNDARPGEAITIVLDREVGLVRGELIVKKGIDISQADQFKVYLLPLSTDQIYKGRSYIFKFGHHIVAGSVTKIHSKIDLTLVKSIECSHLSMNDLGLCNIILTNKIPFMPYKENKELGSFLVVDRITKNTVAVGMIEYDLHRSHNIIDSPTKITPVERANLKHQRPCVIWFTGLSGAGKTTLANLVEAKLYHLNYHTYLLDGDHIRKGLCSDLGFTPADRVENIKRIGFMSKYFFEAGLITLVAAISPYRNDRLAVKTLFNPEEFIEVYVKAAVEICTKRDPKLLYARVKERKVKNMTGIDSCYEEPLSPDIVADTEKDSAEVISDKIVQHVLGFQKNGN